MTLATGLRLAFLLHNLSGGGVQRMWVELARYYRDRGHAVDLLVCREADMSRVAVPDGVRLLRLERGSLTLARLLAVRADPLGLPALLLPVLLARKPHWALAHLGALARYLRQERPDALFAAMPRFNIVATWACRLAETSTRVLVSEHTAPSQDLVHDEKWRKRVLLPALMRRAYSQADVVVAVSDGVAKDLAALIGLPREYILTVYNPVVHPEIATLAAAPVDHPWFRPGRPPVILGVGRLTEQKDFPTLVRAFARVRAQQDARLMILGEASRPELTTTRAAELRNLAASLGVADDLDLPGFALNPYTYMARSALFALSSAWEGLPTVLIEAMACGCPVVSTDCPSGPSEILAGGRYGPLVPVGDDAALAAAITQQLASPTPRSTLRARASEFTVERAADAYLHALLSNEKHPGGECAPRKSM